MKILALSEHFLPRLGGTVHYVSETCAALTALGVDLHLLVPGPRPTSLKDAEFPYTVTWLDTGYPEHGDPTRKCRYRFCSEANRFAQRAGDRGDYDLLHVLFGLFLMEEVDTTALATRGLPSVATVHNLPPMECARSWDGDAWQRRLKDTIRVRAVAYKNNSRLRRHDYTGYVTPSAQVREALAKLLSNAQIQEIPHGVSGDLVQVMRPPPCRRPASGASLQLLTLGGWVPHKRQHLIPEVAARLKADGVEFHWHVAGPAGRISGYKAAVDADLAQRGLAESVFTSDSVPILGMAELYDAANLYIQPSIEEGFCITALDAAAAGLPVIGSSAGALPKICKRSGGRLVESDAVAIASAIRDFAGNNDWPEDARNVAKQVCRQFTWLRAATELIALYKCCGVKTEYFIQNSPQGARKTFHEYAD